MDNLYRGVNPNLNSLLQTPGTDSEPSLWGAFHATHLAHLADFLNQQLPPGYAAYTEQSLQVRGIEWGEDEPVEKHRPRPDVSIFQQQPSGVAVPAPTWQAAITETITELKRPTAVVIRYQEQPPRLGQIVTRIELLSPSNKPGGGHASAYETKRIETLETGIPLIELDYLHETPAVIHTLPVYPDDPASHPWTIALSDPRPVWQKGKVLVYGTHVDEPLPIAPIPLANGETLLFNYDPVYQYSFRARRYASLIDYSIPPVRLHTYSPADQAKIHQRMAEIARIT